MGFPDAVVFSKGRSKTPKEIVPCQGQENTTGTHQIGHYTKRMIEKLKRHWDKEHWKRIHDEQWRI